MFENLSTAIEDKELDERLNTSPTRHLQTLETVLKRYFPELKEQDAAFVRNPLSSALNVSDIPDKLQDQFYDHQNHCPHVMFFRKWHSLSQ